MSALQDTKQGNGDQVIEVEVTPLTPDDLHLMEWARETEKKTIPFLNETLARLVTLNVSLLGGALFFLKDNTIKPESLRNSAVILFLLSLAAAIWGLQPCPGELQLQRPESIRQHKDHVTKVKEGPLQSSLILLYLGLLTAMVGWFLS